MVLWKRKYDPYISVHPVSTTAFLPIIFHPPGSVLSIHIAIYLPTHGQDIKFLEDITKLSVVIEELNETYPDAPVFLRGDFNVNHKNKKRTDLLDHFCSEHHLTETFFPKPTYHHFLGDGRSDSYLDRILFSSALHHHENVQQIECKLSNPLVESHHDLIFSNWSIPNEVSKDTSSDNIVAPLAENNRLKVLWTDPGIADYHSLVGPQLERIQRQWLSSTSRTSVSLLLESTNNILATSAAMTNDTFALNRPPRSTKSSVPKPIRISKNALLRQNKKRARCS